MIARLITLICLSLSLISLSLVTLVGPTEASHSDQLQPKLPITLASTMMMTPTISLTPVASGFSQPVDISHAGDTRLFVVEKSGEIKIIQAGGGVLTTPFLDIRDRVHDRQSEQGLLGLAFHPNYANNGYFYVNYIYNSSGENSQCDLSGDACVTRISRFSVKTDNANQADDTSEVVIMTAFQDFWNHNGGDLNFGPDGYLYIGLGDGGGGGDPNNRAQTPTSLLGKLLRIDVDGGTPYAIPADNPFVGNSSTRDEIWALGLRNPWRFSFDRQTGDLYIGDVGQGAREEIDFQLAASTGGENYGWRCYEGNNEFNTSGCGPSTAYVSPIHDYPRTEGRSVTGGYVYRGSQYPLMQGHYFFADFATGKLWSLVRDTGGNWQQFTHTNFIDVGFGPSTFGESVDGELFVANYSNGTIYQMVENMPAQPTPNPDPPQIQLQKTVTTADSCNPPGNNTLSITGTGTLPLITVTYCYRVENTGDITLTHHTLTDDKLGLLLDNSNQILAPGAELMVSQTVVLSQSTVNVAEWQATNNIVTATHTATATVVLFGGTDPIYYYLPIVAK